MATPSQDVPGNIEDTPENREKCLCSYCPSYPKDCGNKLLFCATGSSDCEIKVKGCICNTCPLFYQYHLKDNYYCGKERVGESGSFLRKLNKEEDPSFYNKMVEINDKSHNISSISSMGSVKKLSFSWDDLHFLPAQIKNIPLNQEDPVEAEVTIGPESKKPLKVSSPILISGMSFGAVSRNVRLVISKTAALMNIGFNTGEGGVLDEEKDIASDKMILQYSTGRFGLTPELIESAAAVEIRFGQGAYPGKGSYLPAEKITAEVARIRGLEKGQAAYSPAHHPDIITPLELEEKVSELKKITGGVPVGAKIGCGHVEDDVELLAQAGVDFIALDGFGGGTGATTTYVRENVGLPIISALPRAHQKLEDLELKKEISLIAGGGLRTSSDFAKCLALGADAVYIGTAALIAINCQQYRVCYSGLCPTGVTTQHPQLVQQLDVEVGVERLKNFLETSNEEMKNLTRIVGKSDVKLLDKSDLVGLTREISQITGVRWVNGQKVDKR
ncbi:MAG: methylamine---glutamate N-methyltransferase subunit [Methanobacterium sp.]|uniref:glutamate synthase-related protein n=1 Tax=Methanobacterium sp. TaxID=2164 RepID=UPI0024AACDF7|nr:glutamate synthase-related protein [Methanobacterium sp.]MDI3550569.1 methylamine---glutamate N-methyltransferase subunit [Methanobacterium sp.]